MSDQTERSDDERRLPFSLADSNAVIVGDELERDRRGIAGEVGEGMLAVFGRARPFLFFFLGGGWDGDIPHFE